MIANKGATEFHVLPGAYLSQALDGLNAPWKSPDRGRKPTRLETSYVISASRDFPQTVLPTSEEFQERRLRSMNIRDKFSLLRDIKQDCFYNFIGEVIKVYDGSFGVLDLYISDYTANKELYPYEWREEADGMQAIGREGDEYGYISKPKKKDDWPGPFGKMTIMLALWDQNATFVREKVKIGEWLLVKNVRVKYGKDGGRLEGFLRSEADGRVHVEIMRQQDEPADNDVRWKDAVKRKKLYWDKHQKQKHEFLHEAAIERGGQKRRADGEPSKKRSKQRRMEKRAAALDKVAFSEAKIVEKSDLNKNSKWASFGFHGSMQ